MRRDLVERAQRGDREAFGQLAAAEVDRLVAVARLVLRDPDLAEDAVQEALVRCWQRLPRLRDIDRFDGWLYRILVNAAVDEAKRRRRFETIVEIRHAEPATSDDVQVIIDRTSWGKASGGFRSTIGSWSFSTITWGFHSVDIADVLGILLVGTAKSRYHYAMTALRSALEAEGRVVTSREASRMNTHPDVERIVTDWLHGDVTTAGSDKILSRALVRVASARQERIPRHEEAPCHERLCQFGGRAGRRSGRRGCG